jgi:hypothetical protein
MLGLDGFWNERLGVSRKGTPWLHVLKTLVAYRLIDPGSEFRFHRQWFERSAMADLLGASPGIAGKNTLYRCLDRLLEHRAPLFSHLTEQWRTLFDTHYEVLLYDLTSTYFECDPPERCDDKRRFGYSRDHRPDCVQVVIGLVVTPEGLPLGYEIYPGNTNDTTTLRGFLDRIEAHLFVSFLAYCLFAMLRNLLRPSATGLTSRAVMETFSQTQMIDVHLPTTDGRVILLQRYTEPEPDIQLLLDRLNLRPPAPATDL